MMTNIPLVSICIPTYNAADFFEPCLQSALAQTYQNIEILISDDGSSDDTLAIAERYREQHPQISIVRNETKGMVNNWNNSIEQAKGEWVKLLFQDDMLEPTCIQKLLDVCLAHNVEVGFCRRKFIIHDNVPNRLRYDFKYTMVVPERIFENTGYISPEQLAKEMAEIVPINALGEPTCYFFNKNIFKQTGMFNPDFKQVVDMEFLLRLGLIKGIVFVAEPLAWFRVHGKSETSANLKEDNEAQLRNIAAIEGDTILLFYKILNDPAFKLVKEAVDEESLQIRMNHLYYSGCKHKGRKNFDKALEPIRKKYKELGDMKYSFFKYVRYRKLFRKWEKENRW